MPRMQVTDERVFADLERRLPRAQLIRFPRQAPHLVPRAYWENAIAVRARLPLLYRSAGSQDAFVETLRGLHRLATRGESGDNAYAGGGSVPAVPGELRAAPTRTFVNMVLLSTLETWAAELGDGMTVLKGGLRLSPAGLPLYEIRAAGRRCLHAGDDAAAVADRLDEARLALRDAVDALDVSDTPGLVAACAAFHQLIVSVHPFVNVNNSLAMNAVNDLLVRAALRPVPHLFLDHLALRLDPGDYARAFAAAVERYGIDETAPAAIDRATDLQRLAMTEHLMRARRP